MKKTRIMALILCVLILTMTLSSIARADGEDEVEPTLQWARKTVEKLNKAVEANDFESYIEPWSEENSKNITRDNFENTVKTLQELGTIESMTFYNKFEIQGYTVYQWKASYSKHPDPLYIRLVFKVRGDQPQVDGHFVRKSPE